MTSSLAFEALMGLKGAYNPDSKLGLDIKCSATALLLQTFAASQSHMTLFSEGFAENWQLLPGFGKIPLMANHWLTTTGQFA